VRLGVRRLPKHLIAETLLLDTASLYNRDASAQRGHGMEVVSDVAVPCGFGRILEPMVVKRSVVGEELVPEKVESEVSENYED
jgi:hypothetical protein